MLQSSDWKPEIFSFLEGILVQGKPISAVFDFDNTLVQGDFGEAVFCDLLLKGLPWIQDISPFFPESSIAEKMNILRKTDPSSFMEEVWKYYEAKIETQGLEAAYRWSTWIFSGRSSEELRETARLVWQAHQKELLKEVVRPYLPLFEFIKKLREFGSELWIATASPKEVIQEVSELWGIPRQNVLGMRLIEKNGILSSDLQEPFTYGMGKVHFLRLANGNKEYDIAFGDTENDFPLLQNVKQKGIFFDRGKNKIPPVGSFIQPIGGWKTIEIPL
ncbi:haloacid dehalogenase-like hydrolase [Leptospira langatensis]|uniref:Haloacid dehalogenase-like hydrolase n=1 Tax=Leptospira langatensis TaxID=2484983 RepID=A0A5F1ZW59_9LEPT|nr:haloacid dehalogenase-like hydrolase [Leptospira langatensis]TGJ98267.1 haloacid dehalogenase-like hydrolase [Leptospira langatensis]TGL43181.1 haloacid dehalogenase-like hydrolase [Leptospira langatensis]